MARPGYLVDEAGGLIKNMLRENKLRWAACHPAGVPLWHHLQ